MAVNKYIFNKIGFFVLLCVLACAEGHSQADIKLSNYTFTPMTFNPGYAGSYGGLIIKSFYTSQWSGFEGAPQTLFVNGHDRFTDSRVGLGFNFVNDQIGATSDTKATGNFAYHVPLNENWTFSPGIKAGVSNYSINYSKLSIENPGELANSEGDYSSVNPLLGVGFYLHNDNIYLGFSVPNVLKSSYENEFQNNTAKTRPNYYLNVGYTWELSKSFELQPSFMTRFVNGAPPSTMVSILGNWEEKFYGSINFETDVSIGGFFGMRFMKNFMAGYSYDSALGEFSKYNGGIHSFFLSFRISELTKRRRCSCFSY